MLTFFFVSFVSCASTSPQGTEKVISTATCPNEHWHLVKVNPPTYFPKGYSTSSPTTYKDGDWVYAGARGERWFIPKNGVDGNTPLMLYNEAIGRSQADYNAKLKHQKNKRVGLSLLKSSLITTAYPVSLLSMAPTNDEFNAVWKSWENTIDEIKEPVKAGGGSR